MIERHLEVTRSLVPCGLVAGLMLVASVTTTLAQATQIPQAITTPDKVESRIGTLDFKDGAPSAESVSKIYDNLDFTHAFEAFENTFQGVSLQAARKGLLSIGVKDNEIIVYSKLMDAKSLYLTANADTVYFFGFIDLTNGPMVLEPPPDALGTLDDFWFRWVIDFGAPGPDRGQGGKYLILPPQLQRCAAGGRLLRSPLPHHSCVAPRSNVSGEQRSESCGGTDQE
jgi:hypothetical protein